jgi:YVTN family beta-propeller protein
LDQENINGYNIYDILNDNIISLIDENYDIKSEKISAEIAVGDHPNELLLNKKGNLLFVANSQDNSVSVINTKTNKVEETLNASLFPNSPSGSTSNGIALSEDEKTVVTTYITETLDEIKEHVKYDNVPISFIFPVALKVNENK